ncbi:MAG: hypothetical protein HY690_00245 [Chloroflexi bacterium]|nr:hypothetical protein [Chloroflexota bacterium]
MAAAILAWRLVGAAGEPAASEEVGCSTTEQLGYHVHAYVAIFVEGQPVVVPANIGLRRECIGWLHTHDASGILHVEAPAPHAYTLGTFFRLWGRPIDATHLLDRVADEQHEVVAYVNGQQFAGAPETIPLDRHAAIVLEYGPPFVPPPAYTFPPGL